MRETKFKINRPVYIGFSILEKLKWTNFGMIRLKKK